MSLRTLTVIADDAGLDRHTDDAILAAARAGTVHGASVTATGPTATSFVRRARRAGLMVGLHVDLTEGCPLSGCLPGLTDAEGRWPGGKAALAAAPAAAGDAIAVEVRRQWQHLVRAGATPAFVNGHNHVHVLPPVAHALSAVLARVAKQGVWVRVPRPVVDAPTDLADTLDAEHLEALERTLAPHEHPEAFVGLATMGDPCPEALGRELDAVPPTATWVEWMVHPGGRPGTRFTESPDREREARWLVERKALEALLAERGFVLGAGRP
ncbi:MAG: ChbG/HpnK family deacetylase [Planctomycetota bacterium]